MNILKVAALTLSVAIIPGFISGCNKTGVESQGPSGESYVREQPSKADSQYKQDSYSKESTVEKGKDLKKKATDEMTTEKKQPGQAYSKEIHKEKKTEDINR